MRAFDVLDDDLRALHDSMSALGAAQVDPLARVIDRTGEFSPQLWRVVVDSGVLGIAVPEEHGGSGGSLLAYVVALEGLARGGAVGALYAGTTVQVLSALLRYGTPPAIAGWLPPLLSGQAPAAWAFTEAVTGSDPVQLQTRAVRTSDGWVLNGEKAFISFAGQCQAAVVFAKTTPRRVGAFLVDTRQPGWQPGSPLSVLAMAGCGTAAVSLDDVHVPDEQVLGDPEQGFGILLSVEAEGKLRAAATCVGMAQRALDESVAYARQRLHRGESIGEKFPTVQSLVGMMVADLAAARSLCWDVARRADAGLPCGQEAAAARIVAGRAVREVANNAMQVCGAYGWTKEMVVERLYRESKFYEVGQGIIELQKIIAGKEELSRGGSARNRTG